MKTCPNNHDNPNNAKFCRICGYSFNHSLRSQVMNNWNTVKSKISSTTGWLKKLFDSRSSQFTPSLFPQINLSPSSVAGVDFKCKKGVVAMFVALFLLFILWYFKRHRIVHLLFYRCGLPDYLHTYVFSIVYSLIGILFLVKFFPFLKRVIQRLTYKLNADYIESLAFMQNTYRIAMNGKLGLFDRTKKRVLLKSQYDNITIFDSSHILIEKNGKKGLFSINKSKVIVPVLFDQIEPFRNSIVLCQRGANTTHYDINGNKMR